MSTLLIILQIILAAFNILILLYAFRTFLLKPRTSLESRVTTLEVKVADVSQSLLLGNDRFREQKSMNEVFVSCMLAFIDFEISYCQSTGYTNSQDLIKAKNILQEYLAGK